MTTHTVKALFLDVARPEWPKAAKQLVAEYGWDVRYWVGHRTHAGLIRELFPDAVFQSARDARVMKIPPEFEGLRQPPLDETLIKQTAYFQTVTEKMLERLDLLDYFPFPDKMQLYHRMLKYWGAVLDHIWPDVVVFPTPPHGVYDYIVYGLCSVRGIRTIVFERATFPGLLLIMEKFEIGSDSLKNAYCEKLVDSSNGPVVLSPEAEDRLNRISGDFSQGMAPHMRFIVDQQKQTRHFGHFRGDGADGRWTLDRLRDSLSRVVNRGRQLIDIFFLSGPEPWYQVKKGRKIGDARMTRLEYLAYRIDARRAKRRLRATYDRLASVPDLEKPYVYVALQAEPERQATPCGGVFMYQYLLVDMLASMVPDGWQVYVKEHIVGLNPHFHSERSRTPSFYEFIDSIPNATLVPLGMASFDLVDHARAVATVSGSSGWEAVVRGTPALLFGYAWYNHCEGVFQIGTQESLHDALTRIASGYKVDPQKVRLFVQALEDVAIRGFIDNVYKEITDISVDENAASLARAMGDFYRALDAQATKSTEIAGV